MLKKLLIIMIMSLFLFSCNKENKFNEDGLTFDYNQYVSTLEDKFYFKQLNDNQKKIYMSLYDASLRFDTTFEYNFAFNELDHNKAYNAFAYDWPEFFWWTSLNNTITDEKDSSIVLSESEYLYKETIKEDYEEMNYLIDEVVNNIKGDSDYDKIKCLHDFMLDTYNIDNDFFSNLDFDSLEYSSNDNILKLLRDKDGTCYSYANLFSVLSNSLGYDCIYVAPNSNTSDCHNLIKLDDNYYYVDVAYDDMIGETSEFEIDKYLFFMANSDIELMSHHNNISYSFPSSTSLDFYYYNMSGKFFKSYDVKEVDNYVAECMKKGNKEIMLVFGNTDDCQSCYDHYFKNKAKGFYDLYSRRISAYYNISITYAMNDYYNYVIFSYED